MTGQNAGWSQDPAIKPASHSGGLPDQEGSGQIAPANSQAKTERLRLSDANFHKELTAVIPHLRAFARMLCGDRDRADDLAQEALMKAWAARGSFIAGTRFRAWIYTILRHHYFGQIRRERFVGDYSETEAERILTMHGSQEGRLEAADVLRALATLPPAQREVLVLMCIGGVSYEEMAEICGIPLGTVKSRIARARAALSAAIDGGVLPETRGNFDLNDDVHDAFLDELQKVAPAQMERRPAA